MSFFKQLWLAILTVIILCLLGSFFITVIYGKNYLENQLAQQNIDTANRLALAIGSGHYSDVKAELQIASLFDTGMYESMVLRNYEGAEIIARREEKTYHSAPKWFIKLFPIEVTSGTAQVANGWIQIGTLEVKSSLQQPYGLLWRNCISLSLYFVFIGLMSGAIAKYLLARALQPLQLVIDQAQAIGERRYLRVPPPRTPEFRSVVDSMNALSTRIKNSFEKQSQRLQEQQKEILHDALTGLYSRSHILALFQGYLRGDDQTSSGALLLIRITDLVGLNNLLGREALDKVLADFGRAIKSLKPPPQGELQCGRLDGSEFLILLPGEQDAEDWCKAALTKLQETFESAGIDGPNLMGVSTQYVSEDEFADIYLRLGSALRDCASTGKYYEHIVARSSWLNSLQEPWQNVLNSAFEEQQFSVAEFPVLNQALQVLHHELPIRLCLPSGVAVPAGQFLGWAKRLNRMADVDIQSVKLALKKLAEGSAFPLGLNMSEEMLSSDKSLATYLKLIEEANVDKGLLWIEIPENAVYLHLEEFKQLAQRVKALGCKIGLEHAGHQLEKLGDLHDIGLDYIKIDASFSFQVFSKPSSQVYMQGVVAMAHAIDLIVIAEGVQQKKDAECLWRLGVDGVTGPGLKDF